ncbi:class I SAM-dependent methyltransferase [Streptomyces sp. NBC_00878]|uniref:class I SAM-dependent methyltransferase n=1 Tax=Streptomyces sp. NBC_00878 TaxID=2975854 RepID=UPI002256E26F|nr:class I SAM-dependent methyltransferase [Streptomyces sp. NBC_00878]MCX4907829.1 class I SAM-dependent methyltransferase [Streptomyces sp. NBC_00878]
MTASSRAHHHTRAHSFNAAAAQYAANRPSYPPTLFDAIENATGRPLAGARAIDVGAGTGIATTLLHARGANVVAVEPGDGMARQFRHTLPDIPLVRGDGNALPFTDSSADFVTYAQAWHWTEPARAAPEAMRVLRPGGALALWWNIDAVDVPWIADQERRVERYFGGGDALSKRVGTAARAETALADAITVPDVTHHQVRWSRSVPLDTHLANMGSHSIFLVLGEKGTAVFLAEEREHLLEVFPDGVVEETYNVDLLIARRP